MEKYILTENRVTFFNVTDFLKDNFGHEVVVAIFKKYIKDLIDNVDSIKFLRTNKRGRGTKTYINIILLPILAKWLITGKKDRFLKKDKDFTLITNELFLLAIEPIFCDNNCIYYEFKHKDRHVCKVCEGKK